jgi:hypothetical protein
MSLQFNRKLLRQREYLPEPLCRMQWRERKEKIRNPMASHQYLINPSPIQTVPNTLLSWLEREISSDHGPVWHDSREKDVTTKVHVMMTVHSIGNYAIEPGKFVKLCLHHIFERVYEPRMKQHLSKAMLPQVRRGPLLVSGKS